MASRRQELSQRRKAVGFTQESLAEHLGVERSTVIRWEAGDSEPLPSIRPSLARALQVSIDQLSELLIRSEIAGLAPTAESAVTAPALVPEVPSPVQPDEAQWENLIRPQIIETVEALRRALRSAGISAEDLAAMLLLGGPAAVPPGEPTAVPPGGEAVHIQRRRPRWGTRKRLVTAGAMALVLVAAWLCPPSLISHGDAASPVLTGTPNRVTPVGSDTASNGHDNNIRTADAAGAVPMAPAALPDGGPVQPVVVSVPATPAGAPAHDRTARRSTHPMPPRLPSTPAELMATAGGGHHWGGFDPFAQFDQLW